MSTYMYMYMYSLYIYMCMLDNSLFAQFAVLKTHLDQLARNVQEVWPILAVGVVHVKYVYYVK